VSLSSQATHDASEQVQVASHSTDQKYLLHWLQGIPTQWRAYVLPREEGTCRYEASVRCGSDVAVRLGEEAGRLCASE